MKVFGYCSQFKARLSKKMIIFKGSPKQPRIESFEIVNDYDQDLEFCFLESSSFFGLNHSQGLIKKNSAKEIKIRFNEKIPGNYWKRIFCIIRGHWLLQLDCFGSVGEYLKKPIPVGLYANQDLEKENKHVENMSGNVKIDNNNRLQIQHGRRVG